MKILLCCGAGMSSGFLASQMRKAAKKSGLTCTCEAKSQSDAAIQIGDYDILCLGPHLEYMLNQMSELGKKNNTKVIVIPKEIYGSIDGKALLDLCVEHLKS